MKKLVGLGLAIAVTIGGISLTSYQEKAKDEKEAAVRCIRASIEVIKQEDTAAVRCMRF